MCSLSTLLKGSRSMSCLEYSTIHSWGRRLPSKTKPRSRLQHFQAFGYWQSSYGQHATRPGFLTSSCSDFDHTDSPQTPCLRNLGSSLHLTRPHQPTAAAITCRRLSVIKHPMLDGRYPGTAIICFKAGAGISLAVQSICDLQ